MTTPRLFGRDRELRLLNDLLDRAPERGGALVLRGEAGIGKSALLAVASQRARERGMLVLTTSGVQAEAHLPFAGLQMLLRPIFAGVEDLPAPQRAAVLAALGMTDSAAPDPFLIALATLDLLAETAARAPLLVIVEDAQWGDRSSCNVLTFVARRLESEPIVMLFAVRDGFGSPLEHGELPELRLDGLDEAAAGALLDVHAPGLVTAARARLLDEAVGNPLALVELPTALDSEHLGGEISLPSWLPLTIRLERAFTARIADLPALTRTLLLVAAVDDSSAIAEVLTAAAMVLGGADLTTETLDPAIDARLITVDETELRFRHPLVRSAIRQAASSPQRHAAHAALADVLAGEPDRRAWHRAAASIGPNEEVASELAAAATRARHRGAIAVAGLAFERAAQLSVDPSNRGPRLLRAAELAFELGRQDVVARLVREVEPLELTALDQGRMMYIREMTEPGTPGEPARIRSLVETAIRMKVEGDTELALNLLAAAAGRGAWNALGEEEVPGRIVAAVEAMGVPDDHPLLLATLAVGDRVGQAASVIDRLAHWSPDKGGDPEMMRLLGTAASSVGAYDRGVAFLAVAIEGLRAQGRLGLLAQALVLRAWGDAHLGNWDVAIPAAEEGGRLAQETGQPLWVGLALAAQAMVAGLRGDEAGAEARIAEAERVARATRASFVPVVAPMVRGLTALAGGRYGDAYAYLRPPFDAGHPAYNQVGHSAAIGYLAEAALHSGHQSEARALVAQLEPLAAQTPSPIIQVGMRCARALLASNEDAEALFDAALRADLTRWPFAQARVQLAYGTWLRRRRRVAESRAPLRAARETFDRLGALPWGKRARQELRAAGEDSRRRPPHALDLLTPQELQIAQMAAEGLSNREIGQKLYLSHRTVGAHLYRIFPKLGVTARAALAAAIPSLV